MAMMTALLLAGWLAGQPAPEQRAEAERLARTGAHAEALRRFQVIVAENPEDVNARIWVGRLHLWLGRPDRAEAVFRAVLAARPGQLEALTGLGLALTADDRPDEAIAALDRAESLAPDDADVMAAQGGAHLAAGHLTLALAYYNRARLLRPADPDIRAGDEQARRRAGHRVGVQGYFETYDNGLPDSWSGEVEIDLRVADALRIVARGQQQQKFDETENRGGGGFQWRPHRNWTLSGRVLLGPDATVLPKTDASGDVSFAKRRFELVGSVRYARFDGVRAWIVSPGITWRPGGRLAVSARYYRSETRVAAAEPEGNNSSLILVRARVWPRVWIHGRYASGTESFDTLSLDRLGRFDADTVGGGFRIDLPSLTSFAGAYEFQWRAGDGRMARVTVTIVQRF